MHAYYFYTSDRVKGLLQKPTFRIHFYPSPFSDIPVEVVDAIMNYRTGWLLVLSTSETSKNLSPIIIACLIIA